MTTNKKTPAKAKRSASSDALTARVYAADGSVVREITLPKEVFGLPNNEALLHQVVVAQEANMRAPIAHTKGRGEVRGGGKKPWKQKGTGRARHGSIRSPIWRGGGTTFGPTSNRDFSQKVNKKMRAKALSIALSGKFRDGQVVFVDQLSFSEPKTKDAAALFAALAQGSGIEELKTRRKNRALIALPSADAAVKKSFRNMSNVEVIESRNLSALPLLNYRYVLIVNPDESLPALPVSVK